METELTPQDILARGLQAARVLADDAMMTFLADIRRGLQNELLHTDASEVQRREAIYFQLRGLVALDNRMKSYRADAEQMMNGQDYVNTFEDD